MPLAQCWLIELDIESFFDRVEPAGTPLEKLLAAVRKFAQQEFALQHRYAIVLHTDEKHPHVHVVVKAKSEEGVRLNIRKAALREWRREFARHLRGHRIAANATDRAVRGATLNRKSDGIYRAVQHGASTHMPGRIESVHGELINRRIRVESGKTQLMATRREIDQGWRRVSELLEQESRHELAAEVRRFVDRMPPALTEKEWIAGKLGAQLRNARVRIFG
jgi:hypothetical protein